MDKIYRITMIGIKKIAIYREYLMFSLLKNTIYLFIQYMLWRSILMYQNRTTELSTLMLYFIINQFMANFYPTVSLNISDDIREGSIIHRLCKPISLEKQYFFEGLGSSITKICTISLLNVTLIVYFSKNMNVSTLLGLFVLLMIGYVLHFILELLFGSLAFFTQSIWGIDSLKTALLAIFSGNVFPIFLYPDWMKQIVNFLPFSYATGKIAEYYVLQTPFSVIVSVQLVSIAIVYMIYKQIIRIGIGKLTVNGG